MKSFSRLLLSAISGVLLSKSALSLSAELSAQHTEINIRPVAEAINRPANTASTSSTYDRHLPNSNVFIANTNEKAAAMKASGVGGSTSMPGATIQQNNPPSTMTVLNKEAQEKRAEEINIEYQRKELDNSVGSSQSSSAEQAANQQLLHQADEATSQSDTNSDKEQILHDVHADAGVTVFNGQNMVWGDPGQTLRFKVQTLKD